MNMQVMQCQDGGHVRERGLGAQVRDLGDALQGQAGAHDLLEHRPERLGRERPRIPRGEPLHDLPLARGHVERDLHPLLQARHVGDELCPLVQQVENLVVHRVDLRTQARQVHRHETLHQTSAISRGGWQASATSSRRVGSGRTWASSPPGSSRRSPRASIP